MSEANPILNPTTPSQSAVLRRKLAGVRSRHLAVNAGAALCVLATLAVGAMCGAMLADWWFDFPMWARVTILTALLAAAAAWVFLWVVWPYLHRPDDDEVALLVERAKPEFRSRLIAALQLGRHAPASGESAELVRALVVETEALAETVSWKEVIQTRALKRHAFDASVALAAGLILFLATPEVSRDLLRRFLLADVEVPRKTRVEVVNPNKLIGRGDDVTILVKARGLVPNEGTLMVNYVTGQTEEFPLAGERGGTGKFVRVLNNVQDSFTYRVRLNDTVTRLYSVEVVARPETRQIECIQEFPAYTKLSPVPKVLGDLALLAGSQLRLKVLASKDVSAGSVKLVGLNQEVKMAVAAGNPKELTATIPIPEKSLAGFSIYLTDKFGVQSKDPALYRLDILPDKPPAVQITFPERKEDLVTKQAVALIGFDASDDFAVAKVFLRYKIDTIDKGAEKFVELDLGGESPKNLRRRYEWKLGSLVPTPTDGSVIEYWLEVRDANNITGPGIGTSDHFVAKVVSENDKRADLMTRVNEYLGGVTGVVKDEERLNQSLGAIIRGKGE